MASSHQRSASTAMDAAPSGARDRTTTTTTTTTYFEQHREALIGDIAMSFEHVLANINKLNRSLEAVIAVGNEFSSVEALWSQFENVMAKDQEGADSGNRPQGGEQQQQRQQQQQRDGER
ncbi:Dolichyl-diphosphooligosaccharide-protein glycosyltransferase subunit dad1 [Purpureocillium takamizusanense]|uniref:DASH complex subunit DAD1 n=1 Tax=Purpureocillium takamizusanense TaxID=2060973 RepID=A0A9Q8QJ09_9HYPO|nr:Dolichyl-diphosphooligosaccharide-protein glycosyltransferase subunit dad1 [Purpureocillium takamizusanense]UNI20142.1 Dolichyl-diphosphooligosaccharide-protein glycosyltransferase subunit dad1 [Purpureocillium takamizusanense]